MMKKIFTTCLSLLLTIPFTICPISVAANSAVLGDNITWNTEGSVLYFNGSGEMRLNYNFLSQIPWYDIRENIDTIVISEGITSVADGAYTDFSNLKNVTFPSTLTTIGPSAFMTCTKLENITLTNRVTRIESGAFVGCESLKYITVPGSVYYISSDAFYNCPNLTIVGIEKSYAETFAKEHNISFDGSLPTPSEISVSVNKKILAFDQPPVIIDDRTLVPLRAIFEALGAVVEWDPSTRTVKAERGDTKISLVIDTNIIKKNDTDIEIDVPAKIINDRTMVPVRSISESLGASVDWDPVVRMVMIDD